MHERKCKWLLGNGQHLEFTIYDVNASWNEVAGLYIFSYFDGTYWRALYVGQTVGFSSRFSNHDRLDEAVRRGTTHIHALVVPQAANRDTWEQLLIANLQPPMNEHHRNAFGLRNTLLGS